MSKVKEMNEMSEISGQKERISFEDALRELEEVVAKLSREDVSLEDSVRLYEEGLKLSGICSEILEKATQKITELEKRANPS